MLFLTDQNKVREQVISEQVYKKEKFQAKGRTNVKALEPK